MTCTTSACCSAASLCTDPARQPAPAMAVLLSPRIPACAQLTHSSLLTHCKLVRMHLLPHPTLLLLVSASRPCLHNRTQSFLGSAGASFLSVHRSHMTTQAHSALEVTPLVGHVCHALSVVGALADVTSLCAMQRSLHEAARLGVVLTLQPAVPMLTLWALRHPRTQICPSNCQVCCETRICCHYAAWLAPPWLLWLLGHCVMTTGTHPAYNNSICPCTSAQSPVFFLVLAVLPILLFLAV